MSEKQKVIITGGLGYIGSHTAIELLHSGYELVLIDDLSNSHLFIKDAIESISGQQVNFNEFDLKDYAACAQLFEEHQDAIAVIHFAAHKAVGESVENPDKYYRNNLLSTINVVKCMEEHKIPNLIFSSSCTVYGQPEELPVTENAPVQPPASPYGATKQMNEQMLKDLSFASSSLSVVSLRYFNPIGAHESGKIGELPQGVPQNLLPYLTQTAKGIREFLRVWGDDYNTPDGTAIRDYIHISDLATGHLKAFEYLRDNPDRKKYSVFNLGTGKGYSVLDVIHSFERSTGVKVPYKIFDRRPGDVECVYADPTKANNELGWSCQYSLDDMTKSAWIWENTVSEFLNESKALKNG